ncbi:carboxymuconolactone decarboxylase family protein [Negadavirga shengliensis]|uniref:Carboxymuconolactone decarboxylase family protein n=1 Tax=Negadavirga shengliensis TaxID=1389218 RepID=A0ABV9T857_9BACT
MMTERISFVELDSKLFDGMNRTEMYLKKSGLDLKLLELIKYRVSQINGCAFCLDMHHKEAIHMGESELRLHSLAAWKECPFYDEKERAALAFAETLTLAARQEAGDEVFDELARHFSKQEIASLTLAVTQINAWNRINKAFGTIPGAYQVGQY